MEVVSRVHEQVMLRDHDELKSLQQVVYSVWSAMDDQEESKVVNSVDLHGMAIYMSQEMNAIIWALIKKAHMPSNLLNYWEYSDRDMVEMMANTTEFLLAEGSKHVLKPLTKQVIKTLEDLKIGFASANKSPYTPSMAQFYLGKEDSVHDDASMEIQSPPRRKGPARAAKSVKVRTVDEDSSDDEDNDEDMYEDEEIFAEEQKLAAQHQMEVDSPPRNPSRKAGSSPATSPEHKSPQKKQKQKNAASILQDKIDEQAMKESRELSKREAAVAAASAKAVAAAKAALNFPSRPKPPATPSPTSSEAAPDATTVTPEVTTPAPSMAHTNRVFEDRGGQDRISTRWYYEGRNMQDSSQFPGLIYESLHRARPYDIAFTAYSVDGNFVDIEALKDMDMNALAYLFWIEVKPKPTSQRVDVEARISVQRRRQFTDIKQYAFKYSWMKRNNLWITDDENTAVRQERCGWIQLVARGTICPGTYKATIMQTISSRITDEQNDILCAAVATDKDIVMDEFNDVRSNIRTYLDL
jgi:hypothetical protein